MSFAGKFFILGLYGFAGKLSIFKIKIEFLILDLLELIFGV
jgi:hypothetical protein